MLHRKPALALGGLRAALLPDVGFRRWNEEIAIADDAFAASRGSAASTQIIARCDVSLRPANDDEARARLVQWLLDRDRIPLAGALRQDAEAVLIEQREHRGGNFAQSLIDSEARAGVEEALRARLQGRGLEIQRVSVTLEHRQETDRRDFADQDLGIEVRLRGGLNPVRVHWVARLVPAASVVGQTARAAYRGTFDGKIAERYADGIPGQQQPVEAWLATLIANALAQIDSAAFFGANAWKAAIKEQVSDHLERGIGFVVEELRVDPTEAPGEGQPLSFRLMYEITGTPGREVWMEHRITYRRVDGAAWLAAGSPDPAARLIELTHNAVTLYLQPMRYGDVVVLLKDNAGTEALDKRVQAELEGPAQLFGHSIESISCILAVPESDYLSRRTIEVPSKDYHLSGAGEEVKLSVELEVRVGAEPEALGKFADALADQAARGNADITTEGLLPNTKLEKRIVRLVEQALRQVLKATPAKVYYGSEFASGGERGATDGEQHAAIEDPGALAERMKQGVQRELETLGLDVMRVEARPASNDPIIRRMNELRKRPVPIKIAVDFEGCESYLEGRASVRDFSREHWAAFYANALRYETVEQHLEHVDGHFRSAIGILQSNFQDGESGVRALIARGDLQDFVEGTIQREVGIIIEIAMLSLHGGSEFDSGLLDRQIEQWDRQILLLGEEIFRKRTSGGFEDYSEQEAFIADLEQKIENAKAQRRSGQSQGKHIPLITGPRPRLPGPKPQPPEPKDETP